MFLEYLTALLLIGIETCVHSWSNLSRYDK